jgi:hypothetical protein
MAEGTAVITLSDVRGVAPIVYRDHQLTIIRARRARRPGEDIPARLRMSSVIDHRQGWF